LANIIGALEAGIIMLRFFSGEGPASWLDLPMAFITSPVFVFFMATALLAYLLKDVLNFMQRTIKAAEEAASAAKDSADLLRQLVRSQGHEPEA